MEIIKVKVYNEENKHLVSMMQPTIECTFKVKPHADGMMAYVEVEYLKNKLDNETRMFFGNSLWNFGAMTREDLMAKINGYNCIQDVVKDFDC